MSTRRAGIKAFGNLGRSDSVRVDRELHLGTTCGMIGGRVKLIKR